jgi:hypothetical protein
LQTALCKKFEAVLRIARQTGAPIVISEDDQIRKVPPEHFDAAGFGRETPVPADPTLWPSRRPGPGGRVVR